MDDQRNEVLDGEPGAKEEEEEYYERDYWIPPILCAYRNQGNLNYNLNNFLTNLTDKPLVRESIYRVYGFDPNYKNNELVIPYNPNPEQKLIFVEEEEELPDENMEEEDKQDSGDPEIKEPDIADNSNPDEPNLDNNLDDQDLVEPGVNTETPDETGQNNKLENIIVNPKIIKRNIKTLGKTVVREIPDENNLSTTFTVPPESTIANKSVIGSPYINNSLKCLDRRYKYYIKPNSTSDKINYHESSLLDLDVLRNMMNKKSDNKISEEKIDDRIIIEEEDKVDDELFCDPTQDPDTWTPEELPPIEVPLSNEIAKRGISTKNIDNQNLPLIAVTGEEINEQTGDNQENGNDAETENKESTLVEPEEEEEIPSTEPSIPENPDENEIPNEEEQAEEESVPEELDPEEEEVQEEPKPIIPPNYVPEFFYKYNWKTFNRKYMINKIYNKNSYRTGINKMETLINPDELKMLKQKFPYYNEKMLRLDKDKLLNSSYGIIKPKNNPENRTSYDKTIIALRNIGITNISEKLINIYGNLQTIFEQLLNSAPRYNSVSLNTLINSVTENMLKQKFTQINIAQIRKSRLQYNLCYVHGSNNQTIVEDIQSINKIISALYVKMLNGTYLTLRYLLNQVIPGQF